MRKVIVAADSFKDSLDAPGVCSAIARGLRKGLPGWEVLKIPLADGGEGTAKILGGYTGAAWKAVKVRDPLFRIISAGFAWSAETRTAFVDMASCSGIQLLKNSERNPMLTSTIGLGDLLMEIARYDPERVVLGIGGSATNDGGIGMASVLGYQFLDQQGNSLEPIGASLEKIDRIIPPEKYVWSPQVRIEVLVDVQNLLFGPNGAAYVFAPQKGADILMVQSLDRGLRNLSKRLQLDLDYDLSQQEGAGAAGGLGAGLLAFANAKLRPGIQSVLEILRFEEHLIGANFLITGEGKIDEQTASGKLISGVCDLAAKHQVPVIALCGTLLASEESIQQLGLKAAFSIIKQPMSLEQALEQGEKLLEATAFQIANLLA